VIFVKIKWVYRYEHPSMHIRIQVEIGLSWRMHCQRVRAKPPTKRGRVVPSTEVREPNFDVLLFAREPMVLAEAIPSLRPAITLGCRSHFATEFRIVA
jgi:hypothetical protein